MQQVIDEGQVNLVEKKWSVISKRLNELYDVNRSSTAVKNYWSREGRQRTGIDERRIQKPNKMVTGVQSRDDRRRARQEAGRTTKGGREKADDEDEFNSDNEGKSRVKRRR